MKEEIFATALHSPTNDEYSTQDIIKNVLSIEEEKSIIESKHYDSILERNLDSDDVFHHRILVRARCYYLNVGMECTRVTLVFPNTIKNQDLDFRPKDGKCKIKFSTKMQIKYKRGTMKYKSPCYFRMHMEGKVLLTNTFLLVERTKWKPNKRKIQQNHLEFLHYLQQTLEEFKLKDGLTDLHLMDNMNNNSHETQWWNANAEKIENEEEIHFPLYSGAITESVSTNDSKMEVPNIWDPPYLNDDDGGVKTMIDEGCIPNNFTFNGYPLEIRDSSHEKAPSGPNINEYDIANSEQSEFYRSKIDLQCFNYQEEEV